MCRWGGVVDLVFGPRLSRIRCMSVNPAWRGTRQHQHAADLSRWLVHLTRSEEDLISILKEGVIKARRPYGAGRLIPAVSVAHRSVCLTETPLQELQRMTGRRPWGLVFDKERLRARFGAQPVWYLTDPSPELASVKQAMDVARHDPWAPIWALTPYVEEVRSRSEGSPNDWRWEREWRIRGDFEFDIEDIALLVIDEAGAPDFLEEVNVGVPWTAPGDITVRWSGGFTPGWRSEIDGMLDRFDSMFITVDDSGAIWDSEEGRYFSFVEVFDTEYAMDEAFGQLAEPLQAALFDHLIGISDEWCRVHDLDHAGDGD